MIHPYNHSIADSSFLPLYLSLTDMKTSISCCRQDRIWTEFEMTKKLVAFALNSFAFMDIKLTLQVLPSLQNFLHAAFLPQVSRSC